MSNGAHAWVKGALWALVASKYPLWFSNLRYLHFVGFQLPRKLNWLLACRGNKNKSKRGCCSNARRDSFGSTWIWFEFEIRSDILGYVMDYSILPYHLWNLYSDKVWSPMVTLFAYVCRAMRLKLIFIPNHRLIHKPTDSFAKWMSHSSTLQSKIVLYPF